MTIEQHAEAAAKELWSRIVEESPPFNRLARAEKMAVFRKIVGRNMQSAVDESTSASLDLLQKTMDESHKKDRTIERQALRIAELEGLGPLIGEYLTEVNRMFYIEDQPEETLGLLSKIKKILKGGAS